MNFQQNGRRLLKGVSQPCEIQLVSLIRITVP